MNKELENKFLALIEEIINFDFKVNCKDKEELAEYVKKNGVSDIFDDLQSFALLIQKANLLSLDMD